MGWRRGGRLSIEPGLVAAALALAVTTTAAAPTAAQPGAAARREAPGVGGDCAEDHWCWENPLPNGNASLALWGTAANDVWAAGDGGTILHWDGFSWSRFKGVPSDARFTAIWGRDRNDVWVAGEESNLVLHWDGQAWSDRSFPAGRLRTIGGGDDGEVWVARIDGSVWAWTGAKWQVRVTAECKLPRGAMGACVWDTLTSSSGGTMVHPPPWRGYWDGTRVVSGKEAPSPEGRAFGGSRRASVWLRKWGISSEVLRWDGARWTRLGSGIGASWRPDRIYPSTTINAIWGASDEDVWAVGNSGQILRWDGRRWRAFDAGTRGNLDHVWGSGPSDIWASGATGLVHWDGGRWKMVTSSAGDARLEDVWAIDPCHAWAVGEGGTVLRRDCAGWSPAASGVTEDLWGVGGSGPDDVWAVGDAGTILHVDGQGRATSVPSPTKDDLRAVWVASARDAWAVGARATILHWDGEAWRWIRIEDPRIGTLGSVHGAGPDRIVAADNGGKLIAWDGQRWSAIDSPAGCGGQRQGDRGTFPHLWVEPKGATWVACPAGRLFRQENGTEWMALTPRPKPLAGDVYFYDVAAVDGRAWILVGSGGLMQVAGGQQVTRTSGTSLHLRAIWTTPDGSSWAVGDRGTILSFRR